jgi:hypothetical protein
MYNLPYCVAYVINCKRLTHKQAKLATQILIHLPMLLESSSELSSLTHEQRLKKNRARTQEIEDQHPGRHDANSNARTPHTHVTQTRNTHATDTNTMVWFIPTYACWGHAGGQATLALRAVGKLSASRHTRRTCRSRSHWIEDREEADHAAKQSKVRPDKLRLDEGLQCGNTGLCLAERRAQGCILVPGS